MAQFLDYTGLGHFKDKNDALYAKQDGSYEGMTVGNAEQLVSTVGVEDSAPYNFRTTGGSADVGDRMNLKAVVGGTVAWNQLVDKTNFQANGYALRGLTVTNDGSGIVKVSGTFDATGYIDIYTQTNFNTVKDHKYYISVPKLPTGVTGYNVIVGGGGLSYKSNNGAFVVNGASTGTAYVLFRIPSGETGVPANTVFTNYTVYVNVFDLTAMFGSTIADYAYTLESGTAGAGVAWLKSYGVFTKPYYPYKAAALESVKTSAHKTYGFNAYDNSTGKAKVVGGMVYQITGAYTALTLDGTSITPDANGYFTPSVNGELTVTGGNSTTTCIHLKWDGERDGEYEPYEQHTYALDDVELRGILKLDASNNIYADGDRYTPDGTVTRTRKQIILDGSTKAAINVASSNDIYYAVFSISDNKSVNSGGVNHRIITDKGYQEYAGIAVGSIYVTNAGTYLVVCLFDQTLTTISAVNTYLSSNPITVEYELATPTTESADAYTELQICNDFGTEEFVDAATRDFKMPVCSSAIYRPNLRAKLEMAPNSPANGNGDYIVRQTDGVNEYVLFSTVKELPDFPTTDGTYVLKCTVADGTATLSWVSE